MASWFNRSSTGTMSDLWIGDVGIRVTNLEKSIDFYTKVFDLEQIDRGGDDEGSTSSSETGVPASDWN